MDRIERYTQQWLDDFAGRPPDWTTEGTDRPLALDRAERAIRHPGSFRVVGPAREELLRRRRYSEELLAERDRLLAELIEQRRGLAARVEACDLAIAGTGWIEPGPGTPRRQRLPGRRGRPVTDPLPTVDVASQPVSGHRLCVAVEALLQATARSLGLREIERLLRLEGIEVAGRPSQTLGNALRSALASGSVIREGRGRYRAS
jgi:hypothetical protein